MNVFSNHLSTSPERPVDLFILSFLELIDRLLSKAKIPYMLVGATARDLLLYHVFGHAVTRATCGLDFAILVDSWALAKTQNFPRRNSLQKIPSGPARVP
jgi:predicted nucleotidyltransferase